MTKRGSSFEQMVYSIYKNLSSRQVDAKVSMNQWSDGPDGRREIDIEVIHSAFGSHFRTVIECKDWNRPVDIKAIDGFHSKLIDLRASKGVMVARKGFSPKAKRKADRYGIELKVAGFSREMIEMGMNNIPIGIRKLRTEKKAAIFCLKKERLKGSILDTKATQDAQEAIDWSKAIHISAKYNLILPIESDHPAAGLFENVDRFIPFKLLVKYIPDILPLNFMERLDINNSSLCLHMTEKYLFGYHHDFPEAIQLSDITDKRTQIILPIKDLSEFGGNLREYKDPHSFPNFGAQNILMIVVLDDFDSQQTVLYQRIVD